MRCPYLLFLGCLLLLLPMLLIGPRVPEDEQVEQCVTNMPVAGPFGLSLNCDSPEFLRLADDPAGLLEPGNYRQSRPGLILVAAVLSRVFTPFRALAERIDGAMPAPERQATAADEILRPAEIPAFLAYLLLNLVMLMLAFHLFRTLSTGFGPGPAPPAAAMPAGLFAIGLLLIFNDVVKAFLLAPHTQMMNILVPLLCLWAVLDIWQQDAFDRPRLFAWAAGIGLGMTAYGSIVLVLPCLLGPALVRLWQRGPGARAAAGFALRAGLLCLIAVAPSLAWYVTVKTITGSFYVVEVAEYDEVIWMRNALDEGVGAFAAQFADYLWYFVRSAVLQATPALAAIGIMILAALRKGKGLGPLLRPVVPLAVAAGFVSALFLLFWTVIGWPAERLAYAAVPPLVVVAGAVALRLERMLPRPAWQAVQAALLPLSLALGAWTVIKDGPFS